jgi:hypothetical protein
MNDQTGTYRVSQKAYPYDWKRLALVVAAGVLLVVAFYAKFAA